jgi:hypothetical protein
MRTALAPVVLVLTAACGDGGGGNPDARGDGSGSGDLAMLTCTQLRDELNAKTTTVSRACQTAAECTQVGYAMREDRLPTCNCAPAFASNCSGAGVNTAAWTADVRVQGLLDEWESRCVPAGCGAGNICACDCGLGDLACNNGACVVGFANCFPDLVDAATDSSPSDAPPSDGPSD